MKTLGRDANNDLYLEAGGLAIVHDADAQCAIIESILQTQQGELQFNEDAGIDYFGTVLQSHKNIEFWAAQVQEKVESLDFVAFVDDFQYELDRESKTLIWSMSIVTTDNKRLDLQRKKVAVDGAPGVDVDWDDVYDKPEHLDETFAMVEQMRDEAQSLSGELTSQSTLATVKDAINRVVYDPNDPSYAASRLMTFTLSGVPLGSVIDFSNIILDLKDPPSPFTIEISDGTKMRYLSSMKVAYDDGSGTYDKNLGTSGNEIWLYDESKTPYEGKYYPLTYKHTIMKDGKITITIKGNITGIRVKNENFGIFLNGRGTSSFPYLTAFSVGSRVPLANIGNSAFKGFSNFQSISWAKNISTDETLPIAFGQYAFSGCSSLRNLTWIPEGLQSIGEGCFKDCASLLSLSGLVFPETFEELPAYCFSGCSSLNTLANLPSSITVLGNYAFEKCSSLATLEELYSYSITEFGIGCFRECTALTSVLYPPETLQTIKNDCFCGCTALRSVYLSKAVSSIGENAFSNCPALTNVMSDAESIPSIASNTFNQDALSVYVPSAMLSSYEGDPNWSREGNAIFKYGIYTFALTDVSVSNALPFTLLETTSRIESDSIWAITYSEEDAVQRFENLTTTLPEYTYRTQPKDGGVAGNATITIKGYVKEIAAATSTAYPFFATTAGSSFENLKSITIEDSPLEFIGDDAFHGCSRLEEISLGFEEEHPYRLGARSFFGCTRLHRSDWLTTGLGSVVQSISTEYVLDESGNITYDEDNKPITQEVTHYYPAFGEGCFQNAGIGNISYATEYVSSLPAYCFAGSNLFSLDGMGDSVLAEIGSHCFEGCINLSEIRAIGDTSITVIPDYCFAGCSGLSYVRGTEAITSLGVHAFDGCSALGSISFIADAEGITYIPDYAFARCGISNLEGITAKITGFGEGAFAGCPWLTSIKSIKDATSITVIPANCFRDCIRLVSLVGCWNIVTIEDYAFSGCSGMVSTTGTGTVLSRLGEEAFSGCTGLECAVCFAAVPPGITNSTFGDVPTSSIPLYVRREYVDTYSSADIWNTFSTVTSRTITLQYSNVNQITEENANATNIVARIATTGVTDRYGMWFADYGDGTYSVNYGDEKTTLEARGSTEDFPDTHTLTLFGDITMISGDEGANKPFLGTLSSSATVVDVESSYLKKIGDYSFYNYGRPPNPSVIKLNVTLNMSVDGEVGNHAFEKTDQFQGTIEDIPICTAVKVGDYAFANCGLTTSMPFTHVVTAGEYSFANNPIGGLQGFSKLTEVSKGMFSGCRGITTTESLPLITKICAEGFAGCVNLTAVKNIGSGIQEIETDAFKGCTAITKVFIARNSPPLLAEQGFEESVYENAILYVPAGTEEDYGLGKNEYSEEYTYWYKFSPRIRSRSFTITLEGVSAGETIQGIGSVRATGSWILSFGDGDGSSVNYSGDKSIPIYEFKTGGTKVITFSGPVISISGSSSGKPMFGEVLAKKITKIDATEDIALTEIGDYTFYGCSNLVEVHNLVTVSSIGVSAFEGCTNLADVSGLTAAASLGTRAFANCSSLVSLYGLSSVTVIGDGGFSGCTKLNYIDGLGTGVSIIGANAFTDCPLKEVQMFSASAPSMGSAAFDASVMENAPLYVRTTALSEYKSKWAEFKDIRTRYVMCSLKNCPASLTVNGGTFKARTFWVIDWGYNNIISEGMGKQDDGGLETNFPSQTYQDSGNYYIYINGDISTLSGGIADDDIIWDASAGTLTFGDSRQSFLTALDANGNETLLTAVEESIYSNVEEVGKVAFANCTNLQSAYLPTVKTIGEAAFAYSGLTKLQMLDSANAIADFAFFGCLNLDHIASLGGGGVFSNPIGEQAFGGMFDEEGRPKIKYVQVITSLPNDIPINSNTFGTSNYSEDWKKLISVFVPIDGVDAFSIAAKWKEFTISSQVIQFVMENIPAGTTILGADADNPIGFGAVEIDDGTWTINWDDGTVQTFGVETTAIPSHTYATAQRKVVVSISGPIKSIGVQNNSVSNCPFLPTTRSEGNPYLTSVEASDALVTLKVIGPYTFYKCAALNSVSGFGSVTSIGNSAFYGCTGLVNLGNARVVEWTYEDKPIDPEDPQSETVRCYYPELIGTGFLAATSIGDSAFYGCDGLMNLAAFPKVLTIGKNAFNGCTGLVSTTGLGLAYEKVTLEQWNYEELTAQFAVNAFNQCAFTYIDMEYYQVPPTIFTTTFSVDPDKTLVFTSPDGGDTVLTRYKNAPGWKLFWKNIVSAASITIDFAAGVITGGVSVIGENGLVCFSGDYIAIDWGDGQLLSGSNNSGTEASAAWALPNHTYSSQFNPSGPVSIRLRGSISEIKCIDESKPFISLAGSTIISEEVVDEAYGEEQNPNDPRFQIVTTTTTTSWNGNTFIKASSSSAPVWRGSNVVADPVISVSETHIDDARITSFTVGSGARLERIGNGCLIGTGVVRLVLNDLSQDGVPSGQTRSLTIGNSAFRGCLQLTEIALMADNALGSIGDYAFYGCTSLMAADFSRSGLTALGVSAFQGCTGIKYVALPRTLNAVSNSAFEGCINIGTQGANGEILGISWAEAEVGNSILTSGTCIIGERAFYECGSSSLGSSTIGWSVSIPRQVSSIGQNAFYGCGMTNLKWTLYQQSETAMDYRVNTLVNNNNSPGNNDDSSAYTGIFEGCYNLKYIEAFPPVAGIPNRAFFRCYNLGSSAAQKLLTAVGEGVRQHNSNLSVSGNYGKVLDYAFAGCTSIESIEIPSEIIELGEGCFNCSHEAFLYGDYEWFLTEGEKDAADRRPIIVNRRSVSIGGFEEWMRANVSANNVPLAPDIWEIYRTILNFDRTDRGCGPTSIAWTRRGEETNTGTIGAGCFMNCTQLKINQRYNMDTGSREDEWAWFPRLTEVGIPAYAFYNCRRISPDETLAFLPGHIDPESSQFALAGTNITSLSRGGESPLSGGLSTALFMGCTSLATLDGLDTLFDSKPRSIPDACFYGCTTLKNINVLRAAAPNTVCSLGAYCFSGCQALIGKNPADQDALLSAGLPVGITKALPYVTTIGMGCFKGCSGINGTFYGLPLVTTYPYWAFAECNGITKIERFCTNADAQVVLCGDSFAGCDGIVDINLSHYENVVQTEPVNVTNIVGYNSGDSSGEESGFVIKETTSTSDPFSGILVKKNVTVNVPVDLQQDYTDETTVIGRYWMQFGISSDVGPGVKSLELTVQIPEGGGVIYGTGSIVFGDLNGGAILWGDGAATILDTEGGTSIDLSSISEGILHTYASTSAGTRTITLYGNVKTLSGTPNFDATGKGNSKCLPFISTSRTGTSVGNEWITAIRIIGTSLTTLGKSCFANCTSLQYINELPSSISTLSDYAFAKCPNFRGTGSDDMAFLKKTNITSIGRYAFYECSQLSSLANLPSSIASLSEGCFMRCFGLTNLEGLPMGITNIPKNCFSMYDTKASQLHSLVGLPSTVTTIGIWAFRNCQFSSFPASMSTQALTLQASAFAGCDRLESLQNLNIGNMTASGVFAGCTALTTLNGISFSSNITVLPELCFSGCSGLTSISALRSFTNINTLGAGAFQNCKALSSLDGLQNISIINPKSSTSASIKGVFYGCSGLSLTDASPYPFSSALRDIGDGAFASCTNIESLRWLSTSSIKSLGAECFLNCIGIKNLNGLPTTITTLGNACFKGCSNSTFQDLSGIPSSISSIGSYCFAECTSLVDLYGLEQLTSIMEYPPHCFDGCTQLAEIICVNNTIVDIPAFVEQLQEGCFARCPNIRTIRLARGSNEGSTWFLTEIYGDNVFDYNSLKNVGANLTIYAPSGAIEQYKGADGWREFASTATWVGI